jgi:hypothetical protein
MITPHLQSLSLTYEDEWINIDAKIEYERNIVEHMSKPIEINYKTHFLLHLGLYSMCNYWSLHNLILGASIKAGLGNLSDSPQSPKLSKSSYDQFNIRYHLGCHLDFHLTQI